MARPINVIDSSSGEERTRRREIIEACRRGDREAFVLLFERYKDRVYSVAYHLCSNPEMAEDLTQGVFMKLLTRIGQFRGDSEFTTWLYRIVVNTFLDQKRSAKTMVSLEDPSQADRDYPRPAVQEDLVARRELREEVADAMKSLNPKIRAALVLRYIAGLSYREISEALGTSSGTVASRINRGHAQLAKMLAHHRPKREV